MVTLILAMFIFTQDESLAFLEYRYQTVESMKECRRLGEEYPLPDGVDAMTYLCVDNPLII